MGVFKFKNKYEQISDEALKHSTIGRFTNGKNMISGGHSQDNIKELKKRGIEYGITKSYGNGVRVGYVKGHKCKIKRNGQNQSWFPKNWSKKKIKLAGQKVAKGKKTKDGVIKKGKYSNVYIGIIRTNCDVATIFPLSKQSKKKGVKFNARRIQKRIKKINR